MECRGLGLQGCKVQAHPNCLANPNPDGAIGGVGDPSFILGLAGPLQHTPPWGRYTQRMHPMRQPHAKAHHAVRFHAPHGSTASAPAYFSLPCQTPSLTPRHANGVCAGVSQAPTAASPGHNATPTAGPTPRPRQCRPSCHTGRLTAPSPWGTPCWSCWGRLARG